MPTARHVSRLLIASVLVVTGSGCCSSQKCPSTSVRIQTAQRAKGLWTVGAASGSVDTRGRKAKQDQLTCSMPKLTLASGDHRPVPAWIRASTLLPFSTSCMVGTELAKQLGVLPEQYAVSLFLGDPGDWQVGSLDFEPKWTAMRLMRGSHSPRCGATNADCTPLCAETANPSKAVVRVDVHEAIGKTTRPPPALFDGDFLRRFTVHLEVSVDEPGQAGGECLPWSLVLDADFTVVDEDYTYDPDTYCPCHGGGRPPAPPVPADAPAGPLTK